MLGNDPTRDMLISSALHFLAINGAEEIRAADRRGLEVPVRGERHRPDVSASQHGTPIFALALSPTDLGTASAVEKISDFAPRGDESGERSALHVFVEAETRPLAEQLLRAADVDPDDEKVVIHTLTIPETS